MKKLSLSLSRYMFLVAFLGLLWWVLFYFILYFWVLFNLLDGLCSPLLVGFKKQSKDLGFVNFVWAFLTSLSLSLLLAWQVFYGFYISNTFGPVYNFLGRHFRFKFHCRTNTRNQWLWSRWVFIFQIFIKLSLCLTILRGKSQAHNWPGNPTLGDFQESSLSTLRSKLLKSHVTLIKAMFGKRENLKMKDWNEFSLVFLILCPYLNI